MGRIEPTQGVRDFTRAEADVDWAQQNGFAVKGHTLLWGLPMPLSSAALPRWAEEQFPSANLNAEQQAELRGLLKSFIQDSVRHFEVDCRTGT
ncbi:MAG: endo-1,4-beta-xylanase [Haliea sp.]|nr:endo-1,4-beta-xylanase [Haliea sp.]